MMRALPDGPILAMMIGQTVIWAAIFYSFPALVLHWQADFGWSSAQVMAAFSLALAIQALSAPRLGRLIDDGLAPWSFPIGAIVSAAALMVLATLNCLPVFYAVWAVLGLMMGLTLYDACFALVTRARGAGARGAITAITLMAGFASTLAYPLTAFVTDLAGWRAAVWVLVCLVLVVNLPLAVYASRALERQARTGDPVQISAGQALKPAAPTGRSFWFLTGGFALSSLGAAIVVSHLLPLLAALGVVAAAAIGAAALIGPSQVAGRIVMTLFARHMPALRLTVLALLGMAVAAGLLGLVPALALVVFAFAVLHGMAFGVISILRPVCIREVLGQANFGAIQGAVVRPSLVAFAIAPYLAAWVADLAGYGAVLVLCIVAQLTGAILIARVPKPVL